MASATKRDYAAVLRSLTPSGDRDARMTAVVDALWPALKDADVSWLGFYLKDPDADELILGPRRDKPACSPIALFGACGRALLSRKPLIVTDVANLRAGYIACDPRDRSELVIPLMDAVDDLCWGVLDLDSHDTDAFSIEDASGLLSIVQHMGLSVPQASDAIDVI